MGWNKIYDREPNEKEKEVLELFHLIFSSENRVHIFPDIPPKILSGATKTFLKLQTDELLIAIFDETMIMKNGELGFAFTTKRLYWKNQSEKPRILEYSKIPILPKAKGLLKDNIDLGVGTYLELTNHSEKCNQIIKFLSRAKEIYNNKNIERSNNNEGKVWYIFSEGNQLGPYDENAIKMLILTNQISTNNALLWRQGMSQWQPFSKVSEFNDILKNSPQKNFNNEKSNQKTSKTIQANHITEKTNSSSFKNKIDLNNTSLDELLTLPGVNLFEAKKILSEKAKKGYFKSYDEIQDFLSLKPHLFEKFKEYTIISHPNTTNNSLSAGKRVIDF